MDRRSKAAATIWYKRIIVFIVSDILKKIKEKLKEEKVHYTIEGDTVTLEMGTYNGGIQLEKHDHEDDYSLMQTWVMREEELDDDIDHHVYDDITLEDMDDYIDELIESVRSTNSGVSKIKKKLNEIIDIVKSFDLQHNLLYEIMTDSIQDYNE